MKKQLLKRLQRTNKLFIDFIDFLPEEKLTSKLATLPSNTIGQQLWCVVGARNSYVKAAIAGKWEGFECPLAWEKTTRTYEVKKELNNTQNKLEDFLNQTENLNIDQQNFLIDLLEHEVQHHGQLVRYLYGLKLGIPQSWKDRYNLK